MLTVPGLCWLCRMPLTLGHWGICSVCTRATRQHASLCPQCGLPAAHTVIPCGRCLQKPPPWQRLVTVSDYVPPLSGLIHQLKFSRRSETASALRVCCCWRYYRPGASAPFLCRTGWSASRSGNVDTGAEGLIRAIYCAVRLHAGWVATGTARPSRGFGQPPRSTISAPDYVNVT